MVEGQRVVLGLGGCLDYEIVWDTGVLQTLVERYAVDIGEVDRLLPVETERDLVRSVLGFMRDGVGGERFVATPEVVEAFAAHFSRRVTLGGTSLRAAIAMAQHGLRSTVHLVSVDDRMRELLPEQTSYVSSALEDSRHPHLIVQYPAGAGVRLGDATVVAARPNRLIYVNDAPNREMALSADLGALLTGASVLLVSGLNGVQDAETLDERLTQLRSSMRGLPTGALVVYEDAGYHVPTLRERVRVALANRVDVHSMNEDEMEDLLLRHVDLLDPAAVVAAVRDTAAVVGRATLVLHTQFWSLAAGPEAGRFGSALESGVSTAAARYLHGDQVTADELHAMDGHTRHTGGVELAREVERLMPGQVCCVPAYALSPATPTTVGLGDAFVGGFIAGVVLRDRALTPTQTPT